jgi:drug/metabolite transporter (DMT)-like permease
LTARTWLHSRAFGYGCVASAALIITSAVALARFGVTGYLAPADILALRFGIGGLVFLPIFIRVLRTISKPLARAAIPLSFAHGWGMAGCAVVGLAYAPASHGAALGPGVVPLWLALLGYALYRHNPSRGQAIGIILISAGTATLIAASWNGISTANALMGDVFFLAGALLAASYFLYVERTQLLALAGNALVMTISALIVVPAYLLFFTSRLPDAPPAELLAQAIVQGILMPVAHLASHHATLILGGTTVAMLMASVPALTIVTGRLIAGDRISTVEIIAILTISAGVTLAARFRARRGPKVVVPAGATP